MSAMQILVLAFAGIALLAILAIVSVAYRKGGDEARPEVGRLDRRARRRDRKAARAAARARAGEASAADADATDDEPAEDDAEPVDPLERRPVVEREEYDITRRQFFNRGILAIFGIFLAQFGIAALAFMWPRLRPGGFGGRVIAGEAADLAERVFLPDGRVQPLFIPAAQSYIVPFQRDTTEGTSFEGLPVVAGGLMALWQRCVHLGCRVPECQSSQGFECPCHGSRYNYHGEYEDGPAPRNLDRFVVDIDDTGNFVIDTGSVIQTSRSLVKSAEYPRGPSCI
jgi:cytochrome b6-f complex iron-sulfur subunit